MSHVYGGRGVTVASGSGCRIRGTDGREYLDFLAAQGGALFGHAHPDLAAALREAAGNPWTVGLGLDSPAREEVLGYLRTLRPEGKAFLCNSGTEAIEAALKLAVSLRQGRGRILAARRAFHGRTMGALALTFNPQYRKAWQHLLLPVEHIALEDLAGRVDGDVAAVFVEPVQGEGGVYPMPSSVAAALNDACAAHGAVLVADEVQSGWGRCGDILASRIVGLEPDIVCLAKGLAGGLPAGAAVWRGDLGDFPAKGHGTTYGGNPLVASVGCAAWKLLHEKQYPRKAFELGRFFRAALAEIRSPLIRDIRGLGLLVGVEVSVKSPDVVRKLQEYGVLALPAGPTVVRFLPPLVAEEADCLAARDALAAALDGCSES